MKKLLIVTPCHSLYGGVESIVNDLARNLPFRGWDVTLGLLEGQSFNRPEKYLAIHHGLRAIPIDGRAGTREGRVRALTRCLRREAPDIVLATRVLDAYEAVRRLKSRGARIRLATTIQCYEPCYFADLARWVAEVDFCVTSGELIRLACERLCGMEGQRLRSIPGGVAAAESPRSSPSGPLRLGYAGRLDQDQKRILDLVEIARHLRSRKVDFTLRIAGAGPEEQALESALREEIGSRAELVGWLNDRTSYHRFLSSLDVFLHTAGREGVSIAPREAMACGAVPVISEFAGFWTERHFLPGTNCLSFPVGEIGLAAEHVARLAQDPDLLAGLSGAAAASEAGIYSESGALDAWAQAFDECLQLPAKGAAAASSQEEDPGLLRRLGLPPWLAQSLRDITGTRMVHSSPGAEWPHAGAAGDEEGRKFERFAMEQEQRNKA